MTHLSPQNMVITSDVPPCVTLIPCNTLEDFPTHLEDGDARSLLAAWTAPWHPKLVAAAGRLPRWNRADSTPEPLTNQWLFLPSGSTKKLPSGFFDACETALNCRVIRGGSRDEFLRQCETDVFKLDLDQEFAVQDESRIVTAADFYALGYAWLQVQVMTRRLRYTSNIDEIFFAGRVVEAARMMVSGDGPATVSALHEAFDALASERDHYFSTDPYLIDLTLLASSTLGKSLSRSLEQAVRPNEPAINFLVDSDIARAIGESPEPAAKSLRDLIDSEVVGVAGGGISRQHSIHHQTAASTRRVVAEAKAETDRWLGNRCEVFARAAGPTPGDLAMVLAKQSYIGAIPIDFASGEGWSSESKLLWNSAAGSMDVLVAKPMDGSRSDAFLALSVGLGKAIDGGEIATALIAHWPGAESDAYLDLRRAASWGLALGRFWKIDEFFREGQRPYHHYRGHADDGASQWLSQSVETVTPAPLTNASKAFRELITTEATQAIAAIANLVSPIAMREPPAIADAGGPLRQSLGIATLDQHPRQLAPLDPMMEDAASDFCSRLKAVPTKSSSPGQGCLVVNPHSTATRVSLRMDSPPLVNEFVFGLSTGVDGRFDVTVDVPAHGFVSLQPATAPPRKRWFSGRRRIGSDSLLVNEFMQVEISPTSGGIKGVYSGSGRGNRYSVRLVHVDDNAPVDDRTTNMVARSSRIVRSDEALGVIEADGVLVNGSSQAIADFTIRYSLSRGSRWLWIETDIKPASSTILGVDPWKSYFALRSAIASEAATIMTPLRDKLHRAEAKRYDSPAGLLVDETSRQTLLFNDGRPSHRKRGERYIDSLLLVRDEPIQPIRFAIGFDVPSPIDALRSLIAPPAVVTLEPGAGQASSNLPASGWLVHCSTPDVILCDLKTKSTSPLVISFLAVATRSESRKAKVRFCRNIVRAGREAVAKSLTTSSENSVQDGDDDGLHQTHLPMEHSGDAIEFPLNGHEVVCIEVELTTA
jgi:hypothetical protein